MAFPKTAGGDYAATWEYYHRLLREQVAPLPFEPPSTEVVIEAGRRFYEDYAVA